MEVHLRVSTVEGKVVSSAMAGDVTTENFVISSGMAGDVPIFSAVAGVATSAKFLLFFLPRQELILTMHGFNKVVVSPCNEISQCSEGRRTILILLVVSNLLVNELESPIVLNPFSPSATLTVANMCPNVSDTVELQQMDVTTVGFVAAEEMNLEGSQTIIASTTVASSGSHTTDNTESLSKGMSKATSKEQELLSYLNILLNSHIPQANIDNTVSTDHTISLSTDTRTSGKSADT
jgi:hypothetical protein